jgi:hypothetical protein
VNKVKFALFCIDYVGLYLTKDGIKPQEAHANAIIQIAVPQDVKNLKSILALCNHCAEFIPNFATIAEPLTKLLRKTQPWIWTQDQQDSFKRLKRLMAEPPVLAYPDYSKPFVLYTNASDVAIGAVLLQKQEEKFSIIRYLSRTLPPAQNKYIHW